MRYCYRLLMFFSILISNEIFGMNNMVLTKAPGLIKVDSTVPLSYDNPCGSIVEYALLAGQNHLAGNLQLWNDANNLYVTYNTTGGWFLKKVHLYVGQCDAIPTNNGGNPMIGQFPFAQQFSPLSSSHTFTIPLETLSACLCISAHAELALTDQNGNIVQCETGWAGDIPFGGKSWAKKINYCIQDCPVLCDVSVNIADVVPSVCSGSGGSAVINAQGGVAPYTFTVVNTTNSTIYSNNTGIFNHLPPGNYITLANDINQCQPDCHNASFVIEDQTSNLSHTAEVIYSCSESSSVIEITAFGSSGPYLYSIGGSFSSNNQFTNVSPGTYNTSVVDANGCNSTYTVFVTPSTPPALSLQSLQHATCWQQNGTIIIQGSGGVPSYDYFLTNIFTNQTYTNSSGVFTNLPSGIYSAHLQDSNGCKNINGCSLIQLKNINKNCNHPPVCSVAEDNRIVVYPNPASTKVNVYFVEEISSDVTITITDQNGKVVYNTSDIRISSDFEIDVRDFVNGTYFVTIYEQETGVNFTTRLIILHE